MTVGVPLLLQFSIALFTGMVVATFVPPVRKVIPRPVEIFLWAAFVTVCVISVANINDPNARELSTSAIWGADQIISTAVALMIGGVGGWIVDHRFSIGTWLVIVAGTDIFALMFLESLRRAEPWKPRVRLGEWLELPLPAREPALPPREEPAPARTGRLRRRLATLKSEVATTAMAKSIELSLSLRGAATQRLEPSARLEGLRDAGDHLRFAARCWFTAAVEPVVDRLLRPAPLAPGEVIDIQALLSTQSIGWYGPLPAEPNPSPGETDAAESHRVDRLAS